MQNHPSPIPARRHISHGTTGQTPLTGGTSSGSPSPIRRAPPSYESIRQSPEKSGKLQVLQIKIRKNPSLYMEKTGMDRVLF